MKSLVGDQGDVEEEVEALWADFEGAPLAVGVTATSEENCSLLLSASPIYVGRRISHSGDFDDWQKFDGGGVEGDTKVKECHQFSMLSKQVMKSCFETRSEGYCDVGARDEDIFNSHRYIKQLLYQACSASTPGALWLSCNHHGNHGNQ